MSTIFFAHANGFPSPTYAPLFEAFQSQGYVVDSIEKIGLDPKFPITNNWPHLVEQLEQEISSRHQEPVIGIGHSLGGLLSYLLANKRPDLYSHLILLDPPVINGWQNIIWWLYKRLGISHKLTPEGASRKRRTHFANYQDAYDNLRQKRLFKDFSEASFEAYLKDGLTPDGEGGLTLVIDKETELSLFRTASDDLWRYNRKLAMPGLYLTAEGSEFAKRPFAKNLAVKAGLDYQIVKGGHLFPQEYPVETAEIIMQWLQTKNALSTEKDSAPT